MDDAFKRLGLLLDTLAVFRGLPATPVLTAYREMLRAAGAGDISRAAACYAGVYHALREAGFSGMGGFLSDLVKYTDTPFAQAVSEGTADPAYLSAAERDLAILAEAAGLRCADLKRVLQTPADGAYGGVVDALPEWEAGEPLTFGALTDFYRQNGAGPLARHRAFVFAGGGLTPVLSPDPIRFEDMVGYDWQRRKVLENTRALARGREVNNVLLYGDSGTGKSATVKAMLNVPEFGLLAIIEVSRQGFAGLPALLDALSRRPRKFILFIDDLSFEDGDPAYLPLKVLLEGGLGKRPGNTALYVTSNRRQLVKRHFTDRDDMNGEETVEEKTSLADRFGIRLPFFALNQEEYLLTVDALIKQAGIRTDAETVKTAALRWAVEHGARTPRTARHFAAELAAGQECL